MVDFSESTLEYIMAYKTGNPLRDDGVDLQKALLFVDENSTETEVVSHFLFRQFQKERQLFRFAHETDLSLNSLYQSMSAYFSYADSEKTPPSSAFKLASAYIAKFEYDSISHLSIQAGVLIIAHVKNLRYDDEVIEHAIIIARSEGRHSGLTEQLDLTYYINEENITRAVLIWPGSTIEQKDGMRILYKETAKLNFWEDLMSMRKVADSDFYQTTESMKLALDFAKKKYNSDNNVDSIQQADFKNKVKQYFETQDEFNKEAFKRNVFEGDKEAIGQFNEFESVWQEEKNVNIKEDFDVEQDAVKREKRKFKSVVKLDKNFHVYIHGNRELIEKGYDKNRELNFYKLYFNKEK